MKRYSCSNCKATFTRKWSAKRHIENHHAGLAEIMDFKGFPVKVDHLILQRSNESQEKIMTTAGDLLFVEEYVREIARNLARENFQYVIESKNKIVLLNFMIQQCIAMFNNSKLGSGSISKDFESLFKIHDQKE